MNVKSFDELLSEYNDKLSKISKTYVTYKISINHAVTIFFEKINKLDEDILEYYFKNINRENINKNDVQKDAFNLLIFLAIKNTSNTKFFIKFFPEYLESESIVKSNWLIIRWLQIFISWIIKPKIKLNGLSDGTKILNSLRDIKHRIENTKGLFDLNLEMGSYKAFSFIVEKFLENKASPLIYMPINKLNLLEELDSSYKKKLYIGNSSDLCKEYADSDTLLKYLRSKISLLLDSSEKTKLLNEFVKLQDFVFKKEFFLFEEKILEIKKFIRGKSNPKNAIKIRGIYNLLEGIKLRLKLMYEVNDKIELEDNHRNHLTPNFKQLLNLTIDKIQLHYEAYRTNIEKKIDFCYGNMLNFYDILNKLERILYLDVNLFFHSDFVNLSATLDKLQLLAIDLGKCAQEMDPKFLTDDMHTLSQFILAEVLLLRTELENEHEKYNERYEEYSNEEWDTDWDDEVSDISEIPNADQLEQEKDLNSDAVFMASVDSQSDSGISDEEENNLDHPTRSTQLHTTTPFWQSLFNRPMEQLVIASAEGARQSMDGHAHYIRSPYV
ncbi:MAG: hypothetical protein WA659_02235 [Candidatus Aquirickettsiella sp.]